MKYTRIARRATSMLHKYGTSEQFQIVRGGGVRIVGGVETHENETVQNVTGFVRGAKAHEIDGERILATDMIGNFTNEVAISTGDFMIIRGERHLVTDARPIMPTDTIVSYRPILRRVATHG